MHVTVFGASRPRPGDPDYESAVVLGRDLATAGHTVVTGGYAGLMEAVSRGAAEAGGHTVGVTTPTAFPNRTGPNPWVAEEIPTPDLPARIRTLIDLAGAAVALPGSLGTFTEIALAWNMNFITQFSGDAPVPLLAVGARWHRLLPLLEGELETTPGFIEWAPDPTGVIQWLAERP